MEVFERDTETLFIRYHLSSDISILISGGDALGEGRHRVWITKAMFKLAIDRTSGNP